VISLYHFVSYRIIEYHSVSNSTVSNHEVPAKENSNQINNKKRATKGILKAAKSNSALSNSLKRRQKAAKTVLKATKRMVRYFPIQKVKKPQLIHVSKDVVTK
jgi:hypothetical protein